ncbi:helix-turn-helix domain-containing protein [Streptomyces sp. SPB074]|uniref:helix-turn-helix domain-containing protein n=1 Tax=Streptomyces sp. (strain SPB074) TaxID=465543 RepID=UPI00017F1CF5|nr:helix-turn-helix transcriptional regulator [Streptomyces sp. SPB074]EDY44132.1 xre family toxin-antitoxin system, antitoxin component [Streptomyces sp. SPB074]
MNIKKLNPDAGPYAAYGARLRKVRQELGLRQKDVAQRVGYAESHMSGVEIAAKKPTLNFSVALDTALGLTNTERSFEREWRNITFGALLEGFPEYLKLEGRAVEVRVFENGVIPGLLQTPEYARALTEAAVQRGAITAELAEQRLRALAERQQAVRRESPPMVFAVLDESCVRRSIGGSEVMKAQLRHLADFAGLPNTVLQIAPFAIGERRPLNMLTNLLTLPDRGIVSYVESQTRGHLDREITSVTTLMTAYHQAQAVSLSQAETVALIEQAEREHP